MRRKRELWTVPDWVTSAKVLAADDYTAKWFTQLEKNAIEAEIRQRERIEAMKTLEGYKRSKDLDLATFTFPTVTSPAVELERRVITE